MKNINAQFLALQKLIVNMIVFIEYLCAIVPEITLNIALHSSK